MSSLNADQILGAEDRKYEEVPCPEWGGQVRIQSLTGKEQEAWEDSLPRDKKGKVSTDNIRASLVARVAVNDEGEKLFAGQLMITQLGNKAVAPLNRIFEAARRLNGMTEEDIEELAKGFGEGTDEPSTSD